MGFEPPISAQPIYDSLGPTVPPPGEKAINFECYESDFVGTGTPAPKSNNPRGTMATASANDNSHTTSNGGSKNGKKRAGGQPYLD